MFLEGSDPVLHTEDPSNEPREWGNPEGQSQAFVFPLIAIERSRYLAYLNAIFLENRKLIRLERNFRWLRWLVRLDLIIFYTLDALLENIGSLPALRHLNLSSAMDLSWPRKWATTIPMKSDTCFVYVFLSKEVPVQLGFVSLDSFEEFLIPQNLWKPREDNLLLLKDHPLLRDLVLLPRSIQDHLPYNPPEGLLPYDPLLKRGRRCAIIFSITGPGKLEVTDIRTLNLCTESLKLGDLAIFVKRNPVSKELDRLDFILNRPSSMDMLAFGMNGQENLSSFAEPQLAPVYLPKEVPLQRMKCTVFIVYYRPDVKEKFIHNLFESLRAGGLRLLDIDLNKWDIEREKLLDLEQGLERTDIHIPIVSRHYEDSFIRHLGELLRMCRSNSLIRPLLYKVKPRYALDIKALYKRVFSELSTQDYSSSSEINEVSSKGGGRPQMSFQTGWSLSGDRSLEQIVRRVVLGIPQFVNKLPFHAVGLEKRLRDLMDMLKMESDDSLTVGICGVGGIGKTTIAKAVFNSISFRFQAASFVADVKRHEICQIQEQILKDLLGQSINLKSFEHGKAMVKANAGSICALIILDDINSIRQLEAFSVDWLAPGSRVILTSRDRGLFSCGRTDDIYDIKELSESHSIELFSWHAYLREYPHIRYERWSQRIVEACRGIPLLLEIAGAFLYGEKNGRRWERLTHHIEDAVSEEIHKRLIFSYSGLDPSEQEIFLDIACFFNGNETIETASMYWEAIGLRPGRALEKLILKSLIWVDEQNKFMMHDYVQEMGRSIACKSPKLEQRTRIWKTEEAMHVTSRNLGTTSVRSISICRVERSNIKVKAESLALMRNLKLLWMDGLTVEGDYRKISPNLIWLRWNSCPLKCFPSEWPAEHIVVLDLSSAACGPPTELQSLWDRASFPCSFLQKLGNLRVLRLKNATYLEELPDDFSVLTSLSTLDLDNCYNLRKLPSCIGCLGALKSLNLSGCRNLAELPDSMSKLFSLERLYLRHCFSIKEFPSAIEELIALVELDAGFSGVEKLPSLQRLSHLEKLILTGCWSIRSLPNRFGQLANLKELDIHSLGLVKDLPSLENLSSLKTLVLNGCASLTGLPSSIGKLCCLEYLDMNGCSSISCLPEEFGDLVRLERLFMNNCFRLSMLPDSFGNLVSLTTLEMKHNCNLMRLPSSFYGLRSLIWLDASDCNFLERFPGKTGDLSALQVINLENNSLRELSSSIHDLGYLRELNVSRCQSLERLPSLPKGLVKLDAGDCIKLKTISDMSHLEMLKILILCNCENLTRLPDLKSCPRLVVLNISRCRKVRSLAGAEGLSSLKTLLLSGSGVSALGLGQWIKDMPYLQELCVYANGIPQWLEHKTRDKYLQDENFRDILSSPVNKTKCGGILLCFVLKFMYESPSDESLSRKCMKLSIRGVDEEELWSAVFSNRQKVKGDQLYICLYGFNHPLIRKLENTDYLKVMAKGTNIQIKECGMKLLYNGIEDLNIGALEEDLSSLVANYIHETVTDEVIAKENEFPYQNMQEEDGDIYDYVYSTSEDD